MYFTHFYMLILHIFFGFKSEILLYQIILQILCILHKKYSFFVKIKIDLYGKRRHLKHCKYADLVNVDTFDFMCCIVVEKRLVLVYTGHKYKLDIYDPKSKSRFCFLFIWREKHEL